MRIKDIISLLKEYMLLVFDICIMQNACLFIKQKHLRSTSSNKNNLTE